MRKFLIGAATATALLGGSFAHAADLLQKAPPVSAPAIVPEAVYSWTGFYAGGNIGAGWSSATFTYNPGGIGWGLNQAAFIGGGQIGYNYQIGHALLGIETDADWTSVSNKSGVFGGLQSKVDSPWMTTVAARVGAAYGNWLLFAKGGGGWVENETTLYNAKGGTLWSGSNATGGWLVGGGIEYAFGRNWSMKVEYDYIGLSNWTPSPGLTAGDSLKVSRDFQAAKLGFNYKF